MPDEATSEMAIVGIIELQVVVAPDEDGWIAQGLEIDYAAGGDSPDDARLRFEHGLRELIQVYLTDFGGIEKMIVPAATNVWADLLRNAPAARWSFPSVSVHEFLPAEVQFFPFKGIRYAQAPTVGMHGQPSAVC